jgi:hypothetical protein
MAERIIEENNRVQREEEGEEPETAAEARAAEKEGERNWRVSTEGVSSRRRGQSQLQRGRQEEAGRRRWEWSLHRKGTGGSG